MAYATTDQVRAWLGLDVSALSDAALAQPMLRAARDIDTACGRWQPYPDTGLKFYTADVTAPMPYPLTVLEARLLADALCAQVEYRLTVGDDFMVREQYKSTSGPGYSTQGSLKKVCGMAYTKLGEGGFLRLLGNVTRRRRLYINQQASPYPRLGQDRKFGDYPRDYDIVPRAN